MGILELLETRGTSSVSTYPQLTSFFHNYSSIWFSMGHFSIQYDKHDCETKSYIFGKSNGKITKTPTIVELFFTFHCFTTPSSQLFYSSLLVFDISTACTSPHHVTIPLHRSSSLPCDHYVHSLFISTHSLKSIKSHQKPFSLCSPFGLSLIFSPLQNHQTTGSKYDFWSFFFSASPRFLWLPNLCFSIDPNAFHVFSCRVHHRNRKSLFALNFIPI